jgi:hypothetical protein
MLMLRNLIAFQIGWFACVLGAASGLEAWGVGVAALVILMHLVTASKPRVELALVVLAAVIGIAWETLLVALGWIEYPGSRWIVGLTPVWMVALWMVFATTLNISLAWLKERLLVAAALGAISGPAAYYGGGRLGALVLAEPVHALAALAIGWATLTPALLLAARRLDGVTRRETTSNLAEGAHARS